MTVRSKFPVLACSHRLTPDIGQSSRAPLCMFASALTPFPLCALIVVWVTCSGMVYDDAEKLYAEVRTDTEALTEEALRAIYPGSCTLSSASSEPKTLFAHNTTPFARRDIVRVSNSTAANVLQTTSDGKEGYVVMEGGPGGGLVLPSQISTHDLKGVTAESVNGEHFVLKNENVRLTVSGGRITSLFDVQLRCVFYLLDLRYRSTIDRSFLDANLFRMVRLAAW